MTFQRISLTRYALALLRPWLTGRRGLVLAAIGITGAGLALGWHWLAALGVTPILISLAPCAAMCAAGLCMNKMAGSKSCSTAPQLDKGLPEITAEKTEPAQLPTT